MNKGAHQGKRKQGTCLTEHQHEKPTTTKKEPIPALSGCQCSSDSEPPEGRRTFEGGDVLWISLRQKRISSHCFLRGRLLCICSCQAKYKSPKPALLDQNTQLPIGQSGSHPPSLLPDDTAPTPASRSLAKPALLVSSPRMM